MLQRRHQLVPTSTCHKPKTTGDRITSLRGAAGSPREVTPGAETLGLFLLLCKALCCPKVCRFYRTPQNAVIAPHQHELADLPTRETFWRGPNAPGDTTGTFSACSLRSPVSHDGVGCKAQPQTCALSEHL